MDSADNSPRPKSTPPKPLSMGLISKLRRKAKKQVFEAIDKGWFGLNPLQTHVVVCGFPRSGSTLLLLIIETCVSHVKTFGQERPALGWHVQNEIRNHPFLVSKKPDDVLRADEIRDFYSTRKANVQFVLTMRDPRAVLTSFHARFGEGNYYVSPERWRNTYKHFQQVSESEDSVTIKYEDLIINPSSVQTRLTDLVGWNVHLPFEQFHTHASAEFKGKALNKLRPLDKSTVDKWRQDKHRDRIRTLLKEMPELPDILMETEYEADKNWIAQYE